MRVQLGDHTFDGGRRLLLRGGEVAPLSPKAFELLALLVEHRPRAVSRAQIGSRLWPDTSVSPVNLPVLVAELRRALGEKGRGPGLLRTLHGFGYALDVPSAPEASHSLFWGTRELALSAGENVLGRQGADVIALPDSTVSRRHARVTIAGEGAVVEDLGSRNGSFVNDRRISAPVSLADGDRLKLGSVQLKYRSISGATTTPLPEDH
jgi:DNA-binding winged helix-turn-helix (wHTH) protein